MFPGRLLCPLDGRAAAGARGSGNEAAASGGGSTGWLISALDLSASPPKPRSKRSRKAFSPASERAILCNSGSVHSHGTSPIAWVHCKFRAGPDRRPECVGFGLVPEL